jgi:murein DD-endopeptidase MepM/ murein hydrolase activator NlpD
LCAFAIAAMLVAVCAPVASASTADDLDAARAHLADAKAAASAAALDFKAAENKLAVTQDKVTELQATIDADQARAASLHSVASQRALYAYEHSGVNDPTVDFSSDALTTIRRNELLQQADQTDNRAVAQLAALNADAHEQQAELRKEQAEQQQLTDQLSAKSSQLNAALDAAQTATSQLQAKLDDEIASAAAAQAAEKARLEAERTQLAAGSPSSGGSVGQIVVNPGGGPFTCPVFGATYSDDFGGPTGHPGIDMFVPIGTPVYAVKAGSVFYMANDGAGGNEAYVNAIDGNTYYYAHLSAFVGSARSVAQGELIGNSGMTGNATAPHVHFEIRIGGPNGGRIDPYPTLRSAGC